MTWITRPPPRARASGRFRASSGARCPVGRLRVSRHQEGVAAVGVEDAHALGHLLELLLDLVRREKGVARLVVLPLVLLRKRVENDDDARARAWPSRRPCAAACPFPPPPPGRGARRRWELGWLNSRASCAAVLPSSFVAFASGRPSPAGA